VTYAEKLKDPRWQKRRLKVMEYAHWRCQICGTKDKTLHCHHSYYTKGKQPWQYPDGSIICICQACHEKIHPEKVQAAVAPLIHVEEPEVIPYVPRISPIRQLLADSESKSSRFAEMRKMLEDLP
jgi:hypothetical protein